MLLYRAQIYFMFSPYKDIQTKLIRCNYCDWSCVSKDGNTNNAKRHLWNYHNDDLTPEQKVKYKGPKQLLKIVVGG